MGMRVSGSTGASQSVGMANWQQRQQSSKDLFAALKSGDLAGAQKAFSALSGGTGTGNVNSSSPLAQIGQALQSGDIAGAQKAGQQLQAGRSGHHHHGGQQSAQNTAPATPPIQPSSGPGSLINLTA